MVEALLRGQRGSRGDADASGVVAGGGGRDWRGEVWAEGEK